MTSAEPIDRERTERFELTVNCSDHGEKVLSTIIHVGIDVEDINDHKPVFYKTEYKAEVKENSEPFEVSCMSAFDELIIIHYSQSRSASAH